MISPPENSPPIVPRVPMNLIPSAARKSDRLNHWNTSASSLSRKSGTSICEYQLRTFPNYSLKHPAAVGDAVKLFGVTLKLIHAQRNTTQWTVE